MKGFIEVTNNKVKFSVNINNIIAFGDRWILSNGDEYQNIVDESYEKIKQLIKEAQLLKK